ncbi:MAG: hypothetical protein DLM59_02645 [Pseudonocardiales bacterium]|nr:MAG: hypothetical protein DLM59_02645 [Pseudonocardiales bacterium]
MKVRANPRPGAATRSGDGLKLHRRRLQLAGRPYTVISLRPGTDASYSTNVFHETWHVLSDWHGARLLGRLLWGLAYQRQPGTLVLVDRPFLDPNPFDAEPADPIALVPALITPLTARAARELRRQLPLTRPPDGTVRWQTGGLDVAVTQRRRWADLPPGERSWPWVDRSGFQEQVDRVGGLVTLAASPAVLKEWAVTVSVLGDWSSYGMDYAELDWPNGEVQVFRDYRRRVSAARVGRREILAEVPAPRPPDGLNPLIWDRGTAVRRRRLPPVPARPQA